MASPQDGAPISEREILQYMSSERVQEHFPIDREEPIPTLDAPVVIECAYPGWQVGGDRYPAIEFSIEGQAQELIDSVKAGAAAIHVHPRDPKTGVAQVNNGLLVEIIDPVFEECGDVVTLMHTWKPAEEADYIEHTADLLERGGGNKYTQGSVVLPMGYTSATGAYMSIHKTVEGIQWLERNNVKPVYQLYDSYAVFGLKQQVYDRGISEDPNPLLNLHLGKHHSHAVHRDPWSHLNLIANYHQVRDTFPGGTIGVYPGGRNWLPILVSGLMLGATLVRVGVEDCYWVYPHKDDIIQKNSDMVELVVKICGLLGRRVVTDFNEAREILDVKLV